MYWLFPAGHAQETEWVEFICSGLCVPKLGITVSDSHSRLPLPLMERKKHLYREINLIFRQKLKICQINHSLQLPFSPLTTKRAWSDQPDTRWWKSCDSLEWEPEAGQCALGLPKWSQRSTFGCADYSQLEEVNLILWKLRVKGGFHMRSLELP